MAKKKQRQTPTIKTGGLDLVSIYRSPLPSQRLAELLPDPEARRRYQKEIEKKWFLNGPRQNKLLITKAWILAIADLRTPGRSYSAQDPKNPDLDCTIPGNLKKLRARVAYHLTEDLLSRKRSKKIPLSLDVPKNVLAIWEADTKIMLHFEKRVEKLTLRKKNLIQAIRQGMREGLTMTQAKNQAAKKLGITISTVYNHLSQIKK
jgi:DNA-binding CsgD family transcriptional regulator